jgi:hypothetical protein
VARENNPSGVFPKYIVRHERTILFGTHRGGGIFTGHPLFVCLLFNSFDLALNESE